MNTNTKKQIVTFTFTTLASILIASMVYVVIESNFILMKYTQYNWIVLNDTVSILPGNPISLVKAIFWFTLVSASVLASSLIISYIIACSRQTTEHFSVLMYLHSLVLVIGTCITTIITIKYYGTPASSKKLWDVIDPMFTKVIGYSLWLLIEMVCNFVIIVCISPLIDIQDL